MQNRVADDASWLGSSSDAELAALVFDSGVDALPLVRLGKGVDASSRDAPQPLPVAGPAADQDQSDERDDGHHQGRDAQREEPGASAVRPAVERGRSSAVPALAWA